MKRRDLFWLISLLGCAVFCRAVVAAEEPAKEEPARKKIKAVLLVGGVAHDFDTIAKDLSEKLPKHIPIEIEVVRNGAFLDKPEAGELDVILMNHAIKSAKEVFTKPQEKRLLELIRGGVGVVAMHATYWSFNEWDEYHKIFGARFIHHPKGNIDLEVLIVDKKHPITAGVAGSFVVNSDLSYSTPLAANCHLLAKTREKGTTAECPCVWVRTYGKGRVVVSLPGHAASAFKNPEHLKLIANSAAWAARRLDDGPGKSKTE